MVPFSTLQSYFSGKAVDPHTKRPLKSISILHCFGPIALRKTKIAYNFGLSECNRDKRGKSLIKELI